MQEDFHYYATYCAAYIAGYSHEESLDICYSAQLVDLCSRTYLKRIKAPLSAATTQLQLELADASKDKLGLQDITRIWASFHFLPYDLNAKKKGCSKKYLNKYRLMCNVNGPLVRDTVLLAKTLSLQSIGIAMHVLADTWAHRYFAGTPSLVINNTNYYFYELLQDGKKETEKQIKFRHSTSAPDDFENSIYTNSLYQMSENSIMNLGHGRAGHLPDYSFIRYKYLPAWGDYDVIVKDNPTDYYYAFCQMVYAMQYLRGDYPDFETERYAWDSVSEWESKIKSILSKRQTDSCNDWRAFAKKLSGHKIEKFNLDKYNEEYIKAAPDKKNDTFIGKFVIGAMAQKSMVTNKIFKSGSKMAGYSVDYNKRGFKGIRDFISLIERKGADK